jgi:hypothetical protein
MLIFAQKQSDGLGLGADLGSRFELLAGPAGEAGDSEHADRREDEDGDCKLRIESRTADQIGSGEREAESADPGHCRAGRGGEGDRGKDHRRHRAADHDLRSGRRGAECVSRQRTPDDRENDRFGKRQPLGALRGRTAGGGGRLVHCAAIGEPMGASDGGKPADDEGDVGVAEQSPAGEQGRTDSGSREIGGEKGRNLGPAVLKMDFEKPAVGAVIAELVAHGFHRDAFLGGLIGGDGGVVHRFPMQLVELAFSSRRVLMDR